MVDWALEVMSKNLILARLFSSMPGGDICRPWSRDVQDGRTSPKRSSRDLVVLVWAVWSRSKVGDSGRHVEGEM